MNDRKMNVWGTYDPDQSVESGYLKRKPFVAASTDAYEVKGPSYLADTDLSHAIGLTTDDIVWHEAAHAIVGHRLGMRVEFIDMTGLLIPSPLCGIDIETVPERERARVTGIMALAGPIGECLRTGKKQPTWRQDGEVARAQAKELAKGDITKQMHLLIEWSREARGILSIDPAYRSLVDYLDEHRTVTGEEFLSIVNRADAMPSV